MRSDGHAATTAAPILPSVTCASLSVTHRVSVFCFVNPHATTRDWSRNSAHSVRTESVEPVLPLEISITRMAATSEKEKNDRKLFLLDWNQPHISLAALHKIQSPCLIVCGDHDLISISHTVLIYQNIPHANLWVVPNSGHGTLIEHADEFNSKCGEFFSSPFVDHQ